MFRKRLIAASIVLVAVAAPLVANAASSEHRHTIEVLGSYDHGCKHEGGWMKRAWRHDPGTDPGPEADPHYRGRMWDFRCKVPTVVVVQGTVTQTIQIPVPTTVTIGVPVPGGTVTQTVTQTVTATPTETPSPCNDPDSNGDENSNDHTGNGPNDNPNGGGDDGDEDCD